MHSFGRFAGLAALAAPMVGVAFSSTAQAAYVMYVYEEGTTLKISGSGTLNVDGLEGYNYVGLPAILFSTVGAIHSGPTDMARTQYLTPGSSANMIITPAPAPYSSAFANGSANASPTTTSGDYIGIQGYHTASHYLYLPTSYVSGTPTSTESTYDNKSIASQFLVPGTYVWSWGSGQTADTFTLKIGEAPVPEPATLSAIGIAAAGLLIRRKRHA